jgi:hypothetical protein
MAFAHSIKSVICRPDFSPSELPFVVKPGTYAQQIVNRYPPILAQASAVGWLFLL